MDTLTVVNVVCVASQAIVELPAMGMALVARFDDGFKWVLAVQLPGVKRHSRHVIEASGEKLVDL
jgi:hypothetical protein